MEPKIVDREGFMVAGVEQRFWRPEQETSGFEEIWTRRFMSRRAEIEPLSTDKAFYGVGYRPDERGPLDYLAGMAVASPTGLPDGLATREVPAARYAVFECTPRTIGATYATIFGEWLPEAPCERDPQAPYFECYPPGTSSPDSPVFIHVPIVGETGK
jgi:predicted transcriptional regulator YdeE